MRKSLPTTGEVSSYRKLIQQKIERGYSDRELIQEFKPILSHDLLIGGDNCMNQDEDERDLEK